MIKECKIYSYNPIRHLIVFDYDGRKIQTFYRRKGTLGQFLYVDYSDGKYLISDKKEYDKQESAKKRRASKAEKKLTSEEPSVDETTDLFINDIL